MMNNNIYTLKEFSEKTKISRQTLVKLIKKGKILAFRLGEGEKSHYRIKESEIDRLISFHLKKII